MRSSMYPRILVQNAPLPPHHLACMSSSHWVKFSLPWASSALSSYIHYRVQSGTLHYISFHPLQKLRNIDTWLSGYMGISPPPQTMVYVRTVLLYCSSLYLSLYLAYCLEQNRCSVNIKQMGLHSPRSLLEITNLSHSIWHLVALENRQNYSLIT